MLRTPLRLLSDDLERSPLRLTETILERSPLNLVEARNQPRRAQFAPMQVAPQPRTSIGQISQLAGGAGALAHGLGHGIGALARGLTPAAKGIGKFVSSQIPGTTAHAKNQEKKFK